MKHAYLKLVMKFKENKFKTILEVLCLVLFPFLMLGIQVFSTMHLLNLIPNITTIILFVFVILYGYLYGKLCLEIISIGFILFLVYSAILTAFTTRDYSETFGTMVKLFLLFVTITNFYINFPFKKYFVLSFIFSVFILSVYFIMKYNQEIFTFNEIGENRLGEDFGSANIVSSSFALCVLAICVYILSFKKSPLNFAMIFLMIILIFLIFKTGSRLPLIVSLLSIIFLLFYKLWQSNKILLFSLIFLFVILVIVLSFIPSFSAYFDRFLAIFNVFKNSNSGDGSTNIRLVMQINGYQLWLKNLFFGYGANGFMHNTSYIYYSHSTLCELLVNFGLIGTIFYLFGLFYILIKTFRNKTFLSYCVSIFCFCYIVPSFFAGMVMYDKKFYIFIALIAAEYFLTSKPNIFISAKRNVNKSNPLILSFAFNLSLLKEIKR